MEKEIQELIKVLKETAEIFYNKEIELINNGVCERCVMFKFATYFQKKIQKSKLLKEYNLDCEYNRNKYKPKNTRRFPRGTYPDIILHKRGTNTSNFAIIECKMKRESWKREKGNIEKDIIKIEDFTDGNQYCFACGIILIFKDKGIEYKVKRRNIIKWDEIPQIKFIE